MRQGTEAWLNVLRTAALELGGEVDEPKGCAHGTRYDVRIVFRLAIEGRGSSARRITQVDAPTTLPSGLILLVRPQVMIDRFLVRRGLAVDLVVGDPRFDASFLVEAAPADVVRRMLDDGIRARLLALHPVFVETVEGGLRVERDGWELDRRAIYDMIEAAAAVVTKIGRAFEEANREGAAEVTGYRGQANAARDLARAAERAYIERVRARRSSVGLLAGLAAVVIGLVFLVAKGCASAAGGG